jgi:hypothetical protein
LFVSKSGPFPGLQLSAFHIPDTLTAGYKFVLQLVSRKTAGDKIALQLVSRKTAGDKIVLQLISRKTAGDKIALQLVSRRTEGNNLYCNQPPPRLQYSAIFSKPYSYNRISITQW